MVADGLAAWLGLSAERDTWQRVALAREHAAYDRGHADGYAAGEQAGTLKAAAELKRVMHDLPAALELELARWGPGGRAGFSQPRPGDYPGGAL